MMTEKQKENFLVVEQFLQNIPEAFLQKEKQSDFIQILIYNELVKMNAQIQQLIENKTEITI